MGTGVLRECHIDRMHACASRIRGWPAYWKSPPTAQMVLEHRTSGKSSTAPSAVTRSCTMARNLFLLTEDGYFGDCIHWTVPGKKFLTSTAFMRLCGSSFNFLRRFSPSLGVKPPGSSRGSHRSPQLSAAQQRLTSRSTPCGSPGPTSQFRLLAFLAKNGLGLTTLGHAPRALPGINKVGGSWVGK